MNRIYTIEEISNYLSRLESGMSFWTDEFANEPKLQTSYYWALFYNIYLKAYDQKKSIQIKDAEKLIVNLSSSQTRRAINTAEERGFLVFKKTENIRSKYVELTEKTIAILENSCSRVMIELRIKPLNRSFTPKEICRYLKAMERASSLWVDAFLKETEINPTHCWELLTRFYLSAANQRPVKLKDAEKFIHNLSSIHTKRIIKSAQEHGYLTIPSVVNDSSLKYIKLTQRAELIIKDVCTSAMDGFLEEFGSDISFFCIPDKT